LNLNLSLFILASRVDTVVILVKRKLQAVSLNMADK